MLYAAPRSVGDPTNVVLVGGRVADEEEVEQR